MSYSRDNFDEIKIGAYLEGRLSVEEKSEIDKYCASSGELKEEVDVLSKLLSGDDIVDAVAPPEYVIQNAIKLLPKNERLFDVVIRLAKDTIRVISHPEDVFLIAPFTAPALRTDTILSHNMVILRKSFDTINLECDIEKVSSGLCAIKIMISDKGTGTLPGNIRVDLLSKGRVLISTALENGSTLLEDINRGRYAIHIRTNRQTLGQLALRIK